MSQQKNNIIQFIITIFLFLSSCYNCALHDHDHNFPNNNYFQQEAAYHSKAYPSYINTFEDPKFDNTTKIQTPFSSNYRTKFRRFAASVKTVNVHNFGATGDGSTDDTKAFQDAWDEACSSTAAVTLMVPRGNNYLLKPITFLGPCKSDITFLIEGTLEATDNLSDYREDGRHWLLFENVRGLMLQGGGVINGNGNIWWKNSCKINKSKPCKDAPTALTFYKCKNLIVKDLKVQDAQQIHVSFERCTKVQASNLAISAPERSPNTDGIHITRTKQFEISRCTIGTGDDCISIVTGSQDIRVTDITCGPGHGISIGSLGAHNSEAHVSNVVVDGAKLTGTTNGVRIKTWQGGSGSASNIKFQNVEMQNVTNPIIIDQNYCDQDEPCKQQGSTVQIKKVTYQNIKGTSASDVAIDLQCSKSHPCQEIVMKNINLVREGGGSAKASCNNIKNLDTEGNVTPLCPDDLRSVQYSESVDSESITTF